MSDTTALKSMGIKELSESTLGEIFLVVLWLSLFLSVQRLQVQFLVGELRSHMPSSQRNQNVSNSSNIVTNSTKTFKIIYIQKSLQKIKVYFMGSGRHLIYLRTSDFLTVIKVSGRFMP